MYTAKGKLVLSASDLSGYIGCKHLSHLELQVAQGAITPPSYHDPLLDLLQKNILGKQSSFV
ncbi:MAG: hypothetical protein ACKOX7_03040 [Bacteroidota bacterium]